MNQDVAVSVQGLSKKFATRLGRSIMYGIQDIARDLLGLSTHSDKLRSNEFWALSDVSFEVAGGETMGVIGRNGSGKSTLLKIINGILLPDQGQVGTKGRVGALIEVGAGFHPMLSGRENIYVNGAILGMSKKEVTRKFESIIDFAEIGDFIDMPVKYYSSGMYVRLGFAVAAHCDPDVLLVDEVLSVGDFAFQNRCMARMRKFRESGGTVVFVSHSMPAVASICERVVLLHKGVVMGIGKPEEIVEQYIQLPASEGAQTSAFTAGVGEGDCLRVLSFKLVGKDASERHELRYGEGFDIEVEFEALEHLEHPRFIISFAKDGLLVFELNMLIDGVTIDVDPGRCKVVCELGEFLLTPGQYHINLSVLDNPSGQLGRKWYLWPRLVESFTVLPESFLEVAKVDPVFGRIGRMAGMWVEHSWKVTHVEEEGPEGGSRRLGCATDTKG